MTDDEAWEMITAASTGVLTTLRGDGRPVALPVWFVVIDRCVYLRTAARSHKARRVDHDPRVHFLVEAGDAWAELRAVAFAGIAEVVADDAIKEAVTDARAAKYRDRQPVRARLPAATVAHYAAPEVIIRVVPNGEWTTWDNRKIRQR
jgi:PPOX class probable F420-dependent enzyme